MLKFKRFSCWSAGYFGFRFRFKWTSDLKVKGISFLAKWRKSLLSNWGCFFKKLLWQFAYPERRRRNMLDKLTEKAFGKLEQMLFNFLLRICFCRAPKALSSAACAKKRRRRKSWGWKGEWLVGGLREIKRVLQFSSFSSMLTNKMR